VIVAQHNVGVEFSDKSKNTLANRGLCDYIARGI
jgi:hypothetical protein